MENGLGTTTMTDRLHTALVRNTEAWVRADTQLTTLEDRMGTMCAHLENISRESAKTAEILSEMREDRLAREEAEREDAQDRRAIARKVGAEVWSVFKPPLGLVATAACLYFAWAYFEIPPTPGVVEVQVVEQAQEER